MARTHRARALSFLTLSLVGCAFACQSGGGARTGEEGASGGTTFGDGGALATGGDAAAGVGGGTSTGGDGQGPAGIFVAPTGSDDAAGTFDAPFLTLERAREAVRELNDQMSEDINVYLRGGRYERTEAFELGPEDSGTNGHRVIYQAYEDEVPLLTGSTLALGFTTHQGAIVKTTLSRETKLRNLYVEDRRAVMASKTVTAQGGEGTFAVSAGQADWAWESGSKADGVRYLASEVPDFASDNSDLEIQNGTTWNENIACVRGVTTVGDSRVLLLQQPYGAIAQLPGWNAGLSTTGTHTLMNALEFLDEPGEFYFDRGSGTLYYYPRPGEDMATARVEVPRVEVLVSIVGSANDERVKNITLAGLTFANTDYGLREVAGSCGKATVQGATTYVAFGSENWHLSQYEIIDTLPAMIDVRSAEGIVLENNVIKHSGSEGISMTNDVVGAQVIGNFIYDIAGSGITVGHPQHVYLDDGGEAEKYAPEVEGICVDNVIANNVLYDVSSVRGFGGHAGVTAFFVEGLVIENNHIQTTAYNGINLGWGWRNFQDSTTCKDNRIAKNRLVDTLHRLHDSGAIYTLGQMPGTSIDENYVLGIPAATSGPTYGLHNDEGSAYLTERNNVLNISPGVTYTINAEDFGEKHHLTILGTYATVSKMGVDPPESEIDPPIAVPDNVWPVAQYETCVASGVEDAYRHLIPPEVLPVADFVLPASVETAAGHSLVIRGSGDASQAVWLAPADTVTFTEGATMTRTAGDTTAITTPQEPGTYHLHVLDGGGQKLDESEFVVRVQ